MSGFTDYWAKKVLEHSVGKTAIGSLPTVYIALFTAVGTDGGTGFTEVSGNNYTRVATSGASWNSASGTSPSSITNSVAFTFPTPTGAWGTLIAIGLYDASTSGNLLAWDYLGNTTWAPFTGTSASPGILTVPSHGYSNGDLVVVTNEFGGTLPSGSWAGTLTVANVTTDTFTAGVNTTSTGNGTVKKILTQAIFTGFIVSFAINAVTMRLA